MICELRLKGNKIKYFVPFHTSSKNLSEQAVTKKNIVLEVCKIVLLIEIKYILIHLKITNFKKDTYERTVFVSYSYQLAHPGTGTLEPAWHAGPTSEVVFLELSLFSTMNVLQTL